MKKILIITFVIFQYTLIAQTPLSADAGPDQVICSSMDSGIDAHFIGGQPSATGGVPPYTYSWNFHYRNVDASDFLNDTTFANPTIVSMAAGNTSDLPFFLLTVTDSLGNTATDSVQILMSFFGAILPEYHYFIHQGDSFYMNMGPDVFGGTGTPTWLWRPNHGLIDSTNTTFWAKPDTSIEYNVTLTDSIGCSQRGGQGLVNVTVYPLGIEDAKPNPKVKVYPNPASDFLQIEIETSLLSKVRKFTLYDILGKEVFSVAINSELQQVDISNLARGSYSYIIGNSTGKIVLR